MKIKFFFVILFLILSFYLGYNRLAGEDRENRENGEYREVKGAGEAVEVGTWWEVQLGITVSGSYRYVYQKEMTGGEFSFKIVARATMEQDMSGDYITYPAGEQIPFINWQEKYVEKGNGSLMASRDLAKIIVPGMRLNYVLKEKGKLDFDFEVFLKAPILESTHPFQQFLLPRSALNQDLDPKNKYNKNVRKGSNKVRIAEKLFLKQEETVKMFNWEWERKGPDFFNSHVVSLELKIIKRK